MQSEVQQIKQFFANLYLPLSMEWLDSCVEWSKSNDNLPPNYTMKNLQKLVYEQWLCLDLRVVEIRSLPFNLSFEKKYNLTGVFYLQVMKVVDISKPKLWQLQRIRNNVAKNTETEKDFGKRVLQLTLTDGVQEVEAMEFKPISCLSINMKPGSKLKITGPTMVRNGRLMLESVNVQNLSGMVDELLVVNAAENVLARALGLEENPNPYEFDEQILEVTEAVTQSANPASVQTSEIRQLSRNQNQSRNNQQLQNAARNNQINPVSERGGDANLFRNSGLTRNPYQNEPKNTNIVSEFEIDDDLLRELEEDFEESSVQNFRKSIVNNSQTVVNSKTATSTKKVHLVDSKTNRNSTSPDLFDDMDFDDDLLNKHLDQIDSATESISHNIQNPSNFKKPAENEVINLDDSFDDIDIDSHLDRIDEEMAKLPSSTQVVQGFKPKLNIPPPNPPKKLAQSKLNFGSSSITSKNQPGCSKSLGEAEEIDNPFSIFANSGKRLPSRVPLELPKAVTLSDNSTKVLGTFSAQGVSKISELPKVKVLTIEKLKSLMPNVGHGKFKIKGKFKQVKEKLTTTSYINLVIIVEDDSGELTAQVHPSIVEKFANITLNRLKELKELAINSDLNAKRDIFGALKCLHNKLLALDNVMEIQISRGEKYPIILNVMEN